MNLNLFLKGHRVVVTKPHPFLPKRRQKGSLGSESLRFPKKDPTNLGTVSFVGEIDLGKTGREPSRAGRTTPGRLSLRSEIGGLRW